MNCSNRSQARLGLPTIASQSELCWWVKIETALPACIYHFGPFDSRLEAIESQSGYIEDLVAEQAEEISIEVKLDRPKILTVCQSS